MRIISFLYLKITGWKLLGNVPKDIRKAVVIAAPHTSGLDFIIGRFAFYLLGMHNATFIIKKEMFRFPLGIILKAFGAVPLDRSKNNNMVNQAVKYFKEKETFFLLLTPEGTRKYTKHWKNGFYHIAIKAGVPIVVGFLDYGKKECGVGMILYPTGNYEKDFEKISEFYKTKTARFPENFNLSDIYINTEKK